MNRLGQRDLDRFSHGLTALHADSDDATFSGRILACLTTAFDCDFASFSLLDLRLGRWHASALSRVVPDWPGMETYQRHLRDDPAATYIMRKRHPGALKISDFVSLRQYRSLSVYREVFGRVRCDRRLGFAAPHLLPVSLACSLNRKGLDFTDADRILLDLFRPHLLHAHAQAQAHRQARAVQQREREGVSDALGAGLGEMDDSGRVHWLTKRAETLLREFFPHRGYHPASDRLPEEMERRLAPTLRLDYPASTDPLLRPKRQTWEFAGPDGRRLKLRLLPGATPGRWQLFLDEIDASRLSKPLAQALKLTPRQVQILHWLKKGKTNWEIGAILGISEKTAGKHLENIFARLNVGSRAAAVGVLLDASGNF